MTRPAETLRVGDVIFPPAREVSLWMRRNARERGLPDTALYLTVRDVREGRPDTRGRWLVFFTDHSPAWNQGRNPYLFTFRARPGTPWQVPALPKRLP